MRYLIVAISCLLLFVSGARAEPESGEAALRAAFADWFVIQLVHTGTGGAMSEARRNMDGTNQRQVPVVYVDAELAAREIAQLPDADVLEGRFVNAADIYLDHRGDVVWHVAGNRGAIVYYVAAPSGDPLLARVRGEMRIVVYADLAEAEAYRQAGNEKLSTPEKPAELAIRPLVIGDLAQQVLSGEVSGIYVKPSASIARWSAQREAGAVLMRDYKTAQTEAFEALSRAGGGE